MGGERALGAFKREGSRRNRGRLHNFEIKNGLKGGTQEKRGANLQFAGGLA